MPADRLVMVIDRDFGSGPDEQNPDVHGTLTLNETARCDQAAPRGPSACKAPTNRSLMNGALRDRAGMEGNVRRVAHPYPEVPALASG